MKHRFDWCDAECRELYEGTPYRLTVITCRNVSAVYGMTWLPTFCPACGGKLTEDARRRFRGEPGPDDEKG